MKIHSKNIIESLEARISNHANPKQEDLLVSEMGVMETCAPYVGQMCAEYLNGEWLWQPYGRLSDYMGSIEEAQAQLEEWS
jgi:hypothetical protein